MYFIYKISDRNIIYRVIVDIYFIYWIKKIMNMIKANGIIFESCGIGVLTIDFLLIYDMGEIWWIWILSCE